MPAPRAVSVELSARTSRACLRTVPIVVLIARSRYGSGAKPQLTLPRRQGILQPRHWPESLPAVASAPLPPDVRKTTEVGHDGRAQVLSGAPPHRGVGRRDREQASDP